MDEALSLAGQVSAQQSRALLSELMRVIRLRQKFRLKCDTLMAELFHEQDNYEVEINVTIKEQNSSGEEKKAM